MSAGTFRRKNNKTDFYSTATSDTPVVSCVLERLFGEIIRKVRHMPRLVEQQAKAVRWAFILFLCCTCQLSGFGANNSNAVIEWNGVALQCISNTRTGPTIAARALAIAQTSMFMLGRPMSPQVYPLLPSVLIRAADTHKKICRYPSVMQRFVRF